MRATLMLLLCACASASAAPPPAPTWRGDSCSKPGDCGWDDKCTPSRCGKIEAQSKGPACEETAPPPGECLCQEGICTLKPADPKTRSSNGSCKDDSTCAVDVATATCHGGGTTFIGPITEEGPVCTCDEGAGTCAFEWSGPVACKSYRDCSWVRTPRLRPVSSKVTPRPRRGKVRPCKDGEIDSVCGPGGVCKIVAWKC